MAHRNRVLADYNTAELREVYLEIFCTTKTTVDNPLLAPSGHGGRETFLVIEEGHLDGSEGYWVEDEDDGAEVARDAQESASSRGRKAGQTLPMTIPMLGRRQMDNGRTVNGKISIGMTGPGTSPRSHTPQRAKERKERREKARASLAKMERWEVRKGWTSQLAEAVPSGTTAATTFFSEYNNPLNFSFMATEDKTEEAFISQPLTPTAMVLDLGCTRAMASRVAAQDLMKFCDDNPNCGIWYTIAETTSQFTFALSESTKCQQKLVICMYDREYAVQSTEF